MKKKIFVLMPFKEHFDEVHQVVVDAVTDLRNDDFGFQLEVFRADDIADPGRISEQVISAISNADVIVADITGSNGNVMYELGYAHALDKPAVLLNQKDYDPPFDVREFRQIYYSREKLISDCRSRLRSSIKSGLTRDESSDVASDSTSDEEKENRGASYRVRTPGPALVAEIQQSDVELKYYNGREEYANVRELGKKLRGLLDTVSIIGSRSGNSADNTAGAIGNCAVELEKGGEYTIAEELFGRGITLFPEYAGLRLQYADFLCDRERPEEAESQIETAKSIDPSDSRIAHVERKILEATDETPKWYEEELRSQFEKDPANERNAAKYLKCLSKKDDSEQEFEQACKVWERSVPEEEKVKPRRALADFMAKRTPDRAIELYKSILEADTVDNADRHAILHNLATVYANLEQNGAAEECWKEAYRLDPKDEIVRASFSQRLAAWGELEEAWRVSKGEPLDS